MAHEQLAPTRFAPPSARLNPSNGIALYVQLADLFRHNILSGAWPEGQRLDNFEVLSERYDVARITVRQAVARLVAEGLLTSRRGRGTVVEGRTPETAARPAPTDLLGQSDDEFRIEILYKQAVTALPAEFQGEFAAFDRYVEIAKVHTHAGVPVMMLRTFVPQQVYRLFPRRAIEKQRVLSLVFMYGGHATSHMRQRITVEPADPVIANQLQTSTGAPVAKIMRQVYGADRRLAYTGVVWNRGDYFEMDMTLPRSQIVAGTRAMITPTVRRPRT